MGQRFVKSSFEVTPVGVYGSQGGGHGIKRCAVQQGVVHQALHGPVPHAIRGQEVAGPGVAPCTEGLVPLVLKDLLLYRPCTPSG
jgi:hypothetical protein